MGEDIDSLGEAYTDWRAGTLGRITDALEQDLILELVGPPSDRRVLDVGCGDGVLAVARAERLPSASESFDTVVAITVLCFIADPAEAMTEMARVLKPGGHLILGELNSRSTWAAVRRIKGRLGSPVWRAARFRTPGELSRLAVAAGLSDVAVRGAIFYPPMGLAARLLAPIDRPLGRVTTLGAAFLALSAEKSAQSAPGHG